MDMPEGIGFWYSQKQSIAQRFEGVNLKKHKEMCGTDSAGNVPILYADGTWSRSGRTVNEWTESIVYQYPMPDVSI